MANRASKEPVGCVNNIDFLASLARSASRDSSQSTHGAGRLRTSGIGLSTNFQRFQEENLRKSSPQLEPTELFLVSICLSICSSSYPCSDSTYLRLLLFI